MKPSGWREEGADPVSALLRKSVVRIYIISELNEVLLWGLGPGKWSGHVLREWALTSDRPESESHSVSYQLRDIEKATPCLVPHLLHKKSYLPCSHAPLTSYLAYLHSGDK